MPIKTIIAPEEVRQTCLEWRINRSNVAFVPTMGALHDGHLQLVKEAKELAQKVVVSIFVNPLQFGPQEDFATYPRMLQIDREKLESVGADALFVPNAADMYPDGYQTYIYNNALADILCGRFRPGHFQGVLTIVAKLFHLVQPDVALFGKKDYQQFKMISKMNADLMFGINVRGIPTFRESDGLAMSSRNLRLSPEERQMAPSIYHAMQAVKAAYRAGETSRTRLEKLFAAELPPPFRLEYAEVRNQDDLLAPDDRIEKPAVILIAAHLGSVRLIDNLELSEP